MQINQIFGDLVVLDVDQRINARRAVLCRCVCGKTLRVNRYSLCSGRSKGCGCRRDSGTGLRSKTHGESKTALYAVWRAIKQRCLNPKSRQWADYGGRGIDIDPRWAASYTVFRNEAGEPLKGLSIDRIDNEKGYWPGNVRWCNRTTQNKNKRNNVTFEYKGKDLTLNDLSELCGINKRTLASRIYLYGWSVVEAVETPVKAQGMAA